MAIREAQLALLLLLLANLALSLAADMDPASASVSVGTTIMGIDEDDDAEEMMLDSESSRRVLYQSRYLSNSVLQKDSVPCGRRGPSYYFCRSHVPVRPYTRGCSRFTRCGGRYT